MRISLNDIFIYAKCTSTSRNLIEGEQVINCNHIVLCGKIQVENVNSKAFILCEQCDILFCLNTYFLFCLES